MELVALTRQELFDLVWSIPIRTLAERYGITDVALGKRCKKHGIPKPGVGYWARVAAGQQPKRATLPWSPSPHLERIVFKPAVPLKLAVPRDETPVIEVGAKLLEPHQATLWARQRLEEAVKDHYGRLQVGGSYRPDLCVRPESVRRALLLIDTVVKALVARGHEVLVAPHHPKAEPTIILQVSGERLGLRRSFASSLRRMRRPFAPLERRGTGWRRPATTSTGSIPSQAAEPSTTSSSHPMRSWSS